MTTQSFHDNHTLLVKFECATSQQILQSFITAFKTYQNDNNTTLKCKFKVNYVEDRDGKSFGFAFVFVTNSSVYNMILGKNPDGSDRVEYKEDLTWEPPIENSYVNKSGLSVVDKPEKKPDHSDISWADMLEADDEYEAQILEQQILQEKERQKKIRPKIAFTLESLMKIPPVVLTLDQIEKKREKIINDNKQDFDIDSIYIQETEYLNVERALVFQINQKFISNILKCKNVHPSITKHDIKTQFLQYASDSTTLHERIVKGKRVKESYPFVNINDDRVAFVIFDQSTRDAQFALHMMKKTIIKKKIDNIDHNMMLFFSHSYRTDRDIVSNFKEKHTYTSSRYNQNDTRNHYQKNRNNDSYSTKNNDTKNKVVTPEKKNPYSLLDEE